MRTTGLDRRRQSVAGRAGTEEEKEEGRTEGGRKRGREGPRSWNGKGPGAKKPAAPESGPHPNEDFTFAKCPAPIFILCSTLTGNISKTSLKLSGS